MDVPALAKAGKLEKASGAVLKAFLKERKVTQTGEKSVLVWRIQAWLEFEAAGDNPFKLTAAELRKVCAREGVSPIGTNDEMLEALLAHRRTAAAPAEASGGSPVLTPQGLCEEVLRLSDLGEYRAILQLGNPKDDEVPSLRKAYLKVSLSIHPDKLKTPDSKKAFQALVEAFERITRPEVYDDQGPGKDLAISRSNENCFRTVVGCPRCHEPWGRSVDGVPKYAYNFFMTGVKQYHCSTCLLKFGCMAAEHKCPHCKKTAAYDPARFHVQNTCPMCSKDYGYHMFDVPERARKDLKEDVRKQLEQERIHEQQQKRRAKFHEKRYGGEADAETAFKVGLSNACPKCGFYPRDREELQEHLKSECDPGAVAKHAAKQEKLARVEKVKERKAAAQSNLAAQAGWSFCGGGAASLWLLTDAALEEQCRQHGLETGTREEMISRLAPKVGGAAMLEDSDATLQRLSKEQLREVCVGQGMEPGKSKKDMLNSLFVRRDELMLADAKPAKKRKTDADAPEA